ncbi:hypothetical protein [Bdellovibrio sp. HCB209]|uniref:hypothetical protein n=1 Tax=Bdellovibrio sp. HCB209 TaxID=3394354 RepID=UPI0039B4F915
MFTRFKTITLLGVLMAATSHAEISTSNLSAESSSVFNKAITIEQDYSESMRAEREGNSGASTVIVSPISNSSVSSSSSGMFSSGTSAMSYPSTLGMRSERKVGAGMSVGGQLGLVGITGEFNFEDENGVIAGFGTGPGYNSIQLAWKHAFEGDYIAPYYTAGYSRWYNSMGSSGAWKDSGILDRVLTDDEKRTGRFGTDFLNASFGIQYNQLSGDFSGVSAFVEVVAMYEVKRSQLIPSGTVGALYYF